MIRSQIGPGQYSACFLAQFTDTPCDGDLRRCHVIPQQLLRRELGKERARELGQDPRTYVLGCGGPMGNGGHHGELDYAKTLRIPRSALGSDLEALVVQLDAEFAGNPFGAYLDRTFGRE